MTVYVICIARPSWTLWDDSIETVESIESSSSLYAKRVELLKFVVRNNEKWRHVLNQNIRWTKELRSPYHGAADASDQVSADTWAILRPWRDDGIEKQIAPFPVIKKVIDNYLWCGSFVQYAVHVLNTSLTCLTTQYLLLQIKLIIMLAKKMKMGDMETDGDETVNELSDTDTALLMAKIKDINSILVVYIDKLSVAKSDMHLISGVLFMMTEVLEEYPKYHVYVLSLMRKEIEQAVGDSCVPTGDAELYGHFVGEANYDDLGRDEATREDTMHAFEAVFAGANKMYGDLGIETMPLENWRQILNIEKPVHERINLSTYKNLAGLLIQNKQGIDIVAREWKNYQTVKLQKSTANDRVADSPNET